MQRLMHAAIFASAMIFAAAPAVAANPSKLSAPNLLAKVDAAVGDANVRTVIVTLSTTIHGKYATITTMMKRPDHILERIRVPQNNATVTIAATGNTAWIQGPDGRVLTSDTATKTSGSTS